MMKFFILVSMGLLILGAQQKRTWTITKSDCIGEYCCSPEIGSELTIISNPNEKSTLIVPDLSGIKSCDKKWAEKSIWIPVELEKITCEFADYFKIFENNDQIVTIKSTSSLFETALFIQVIFPNLEIYEFTAVQSPIWQGVFYLLVECDPSICCCPDSRLMTFTPDPNNSSQVLISATFPQNSICNTLGWSSQNPISWPWPSNFQSNNSSPVTFNGSNGLVFTLATVSYPNGTIYIDMKLNLTAAGGSGACFLQINDAPPAWMGEWLVLETCNPESCCCPNIGDNIQFSVNPNNSSEILLNASWPYNPICQKLGWNSNTLVAFPISQFDIYLDNQYYQYSSNNGLIYTVTSFQQYNYTYVASLNINQQSVKGAQTCSLQVNNAVPSWNGGWVTILQCGILNCCCPEIGSNIIMTPDPQNSSQLIISGFDVFGLACQSMHWQNQSTFVFPWGNYDLYFNGSMHYRDGMGIKYNFTMEYLDNGTIAGWIQMDQTSVGGPDYCAIPLNNNLL